MRKFYRVLSAIVLVSMLLTLTACDGANSSSWRTSVNVSERRLNNGFEISVGSTSSGRRNQTFTLTSEQLASIHATSTSEEGEIILVISQDGAEDGTEVVLDISNFTGYIYEGSLEAGRIRFSLRYDGIRNSSTIIIWE